MKPYSPCRIPQNLVSLMQNPYVNVHLPVIQLQNRQERDANREPGDTYNDNMDEASAQQS